MLTPGDARLQILHGGHDACDAPVLCLSLSADTQQKGFFSRSIRKLESLLDKGSSNPLEFDPDIGTRLNADQKQLLHLNRALLYYLSGGSCFIISSRCSLSRSCGWQKAIASHVPYSL